MRCCKSPPPPVAVCGRQSRCLKGGTHERPRAGVSPEGTAGGAPPPPHGGERLVARLLPPWPAPPPGGRGNEEKGRGWAASPPGRGPGERPASRCPRSP